MSINFLEHTKSYTEKQHTLEHKGDFLFISEKISAKKTFHKENIRTVIVLASFFIILSLAVLFIWGVLSWWVMTFSIVLFLYFSSLVFKFFLVGISFINNIPEPTQREIQEISDEDLPPYTILVPMYKEKQLLINFVNYLKNIDYPKEKLDVRILLEEDDKETIDVANSINLEAPFSVVIIPNAGPRTKPKALNVGFIDDESEILTIYDAEDRPELDQLKKVAWSFKNLSEKVVCAQAKLTFYNPNENLLSKWFSAEYHSWFNHFLPALFSLSLPIPLGGTSNHFKTSILKEIGGWDPYNVTEDADLGIRISRHGYKISMIDSTSVRQTTTETGVNQPIAVIESSTYEEANTKLGNWMLQRIRWMKGYLQTAVVNLRDPFKAANDLSWKGFLSFFFFLIGTPITHLLNIVVWTITILWIMDYTIMPLGIPYFLLLGGWISFIGGNTFFILLHFIPALVARKWRIAFASLLIPIYWLLMSIATIIAVYELFKRPHYWNKTEHGVSKVFF